MSRVPAVLRNVTVAYRRRCFGARTDISIAELYDLLKDNEILRRNQDLAHLMLRNTIEHLVNVDKNLGEMKHVIIRHNIPETITAEGIAELVAYLSTLHAISGCQI